MLKIDVFTSTTFKHTVCVATVKFVAIIYKVTPILIFLVQNFVIPLAKACVAVSFDLFQYPHPQSI